MAVQRAAGDAGRRLHRSGPALSTLVIVLCAALLVWYGLGSIAHAQSTVDYDTDDDGLIEIASVAQLDAVRWDLNGDGVVDFGGDATGYATAFPTPVTSPPMGCPSACAGYELTANLDLASAGHRLYGWVPLGDDTTPFTATFDGANFTISNLFISRGFPGGMDNVGLFGVTGAGSVIRRVTLEDVDVTGDADTGALVGYNAEGSIRESSASGVVIAFSGGGLVGENASGDIRGSAAQVDVTGSSQSREIGGLVGRNSGTVRDSDATGNVSGFDYVGGLVGINFGAGGGNEISGSTASGTATATNGGRVGGLVGWNNGPIRDSHASGDVTGVATSTAGVVSWIGGLVGTNNGAGGVNEISGSTASGSVTGDSVVGGLVGWNNGPVRNSHATGNVTGGSSGRVGGLIGNNYDELAWNDPTVAAVNAVQGSTASGTVTSLGGLVGGLVGWNNGPISDSDARGTLVKGYWSVGGLVGANNDQHGVSNTIMRSTASAAVEGNAANSQNLGGLVGWNNGAISDSHARGDVQGRTNSGGLVGWHSGSITDSSAAGAVGDATSDGNFVGGLVGLNTAGTISGSSATGDVTSTGSTIGGLAGRSEGTITESAASGTVAGGNVVGGLIGYQHPDGSTSASHAGGTVTGEVDVGGLIGWADGLIWASYATGAVTGSDEVGGLVGNLGGKIIAAYASGNVAGSVDAAGGLVGVSRRSHAADPSPSSVLASYAAGSVSGAATNIGGLAGTAEGPLTTYLAATFTNSYWDTERSGRSIGAGSDDEDANGSIDGDETATSGATGQTTSALRTPTGYTGIYAAWKVDMDGNADTSSGDGPWNFGENTDDPALRGPSDPPSFSSTAVQLTVAEGTAAGSDVGAPVAATDSNSDTLTYKLVGAGGTAFDIVTATGQLQTKAELDYEGRTSYTVTVQASDGKLVAFKDVAVTVTDVNEPPALSGDTAPAVPENSLYVDTYTVTDPEGDAVGAITWSVAGTDGSHFTMADGILSFSAAPDYEDTMSSVTYAVIVQAAVAGQSTPLTLAVTVSVANADEAGTVTLSAAQPEKGTALTARLSDPDGGETGVTWQWARAPTPNGAWTDIAATSDTYTPVSGDAEYYLRATASYDDDQGSGKRARAVSDNPLAPEPAVSIRPTSLTIDEGNRGSYFVELRTQPAGDVIVTINDPTDNTDVTAAPATLTFTTTDWNMNQGVVVSAAKDADLADDTATVTHTVSGYGSVTTAPDVAIIVKDNIIGVTVTPTSLTVNEGATGTYTVVLDTQPTGDVTVTPSSGDTSAVTVPGALTFNALNWNTAQPVTVSAIEDGDSTGETVTVSNAVSGADYGAVTASSVTVTVRDDEPASVTVTPTSLRVNEGATGTYMVVLTRLPTGDVTVTPSSSDTSAVTVSGALTFSTTNWDTAQAVTVSAIEDLDLIGETVAVSHAVSGVEYAGVTAPSVTVNVNDNDTPAVLVSSTSLRINEGQSRKYEVWLRKQPTGSVTVTINDPADNTDVTAEPATLTFTTTDWSTAQTVTVRAAVDDDAADETATVTHTVSGYGTVTAAPDVTVAVTDNDRRGVTVRPTSLTMIEGGSGKYTVALGTEPTGDVTVTINDPTDNTDVTVEPADLTFTTTDWNAAQTVTVSAAQDTDQAGDTATVTHTVAGADYGAVTASSVTVTVRDDEDPAVVDTCGRTPEVRDWILNSAGLTDCAAVLDTDLAGLQGWLDVDGYSSPTLLSSDFEGLTGEFTRLLFRDSQLKTVPAGAFDWVTNKAAVTHIYFNNSGIETLGAGVFNGFTGLMGIDLTANLIITLAPNTFSGLTSLTQVSLHANRLTALPASIFSGLTSLELIFLGENRLTELPATTFSGLTNLGQIDLQGNRLTELPANAFNGLTSLGAVQLQDNSLTALPAGIFTGLSSVHTLGLSGNDLTTLPANTFSGLTNLFVLQLDGNGLTALDPALFSPFRNSLLLLRLEDNALTTLPAGVFTGLSGVTLLNLSDNDLTTLSAGVFTGLTGLKSLFLFDNEIATLTDASFDSLGASLTTLYLPGNGLASVSAGAFTNLTGLTELQLHDNALTTLPAGVFTGLTSLTTLYLSDNKIATLPAGAFTGLTALRLLYLYDNALATLEPTLFAPLDDSLTSMRLSDNALTTLPAGVFTGLTGMTNLYLDNNAITTLPANTFSGLTRLLWLDLSDNSLATLPLTLFTPLNGLGRLHLRSNSLTALPESIFDGLTSLRSLDLSCNALTEFDLTDPTPFDPFAGTLRYLDVGANAFTVPPADAAVRAKLTALEHLYLTGAPPCLSALNTDLSSLAVSAGTLTPAFGEQVRNYAVTVPHDVATITITPMPKDSNATISRITVNPPQPLDDNFADGIEATLRYGWTDVTFHVRPEDKTYSDLFYQVRVTREQPPIDPTAGYDANGDGMIDKSEVIVAIKDYFRGDFSKSLVLILIKRYFSGS